MHADNNNQERFKNHLGTNGQHGSANTDGKKKEIERAKKRAGKITKLIRDVLDHDDPLAKDQLFKLLKAELLKRAEQRISGERKGYTLTPSGLVHECYIKLVNAKKLSINDRKHFLAIASKYMRQILIDRSRRRRKPTTMLDEESMDFLSIQKDIDMIMDIHTALEELEKFHAGWAKVAHLKFFGQLKTKEIAEIMEKDERTVQRYWQNARTWLYNRLGNPPGNELKPAC